MQQKILEFIVDDQFIRAPHYTVVADSKDYLVARFIFSPQWQGLVKTAVFQAADGKAYYVVLDKDTCPIPQEVIQPTCFLVSVFGGDRLTADRAMVEVAASGYTANGTTPPQPTPDVYNQLMEAVSTDRQLAEAAATTAAEKADLCVESVDSCTELTLGAENAASTAGFKAEECAYLVSSAKSLLDSAMDISHFVEEVEDVAHYVRMDAVLADERATTAQESADAAAQHKEEAQQAAATATTAAQEAALAASAAKNELQLLETVDITALTDAITLSFSGRNLKELYFEGVVCSGDRSTLLQNFTIGITRGTTIWSANGSFGHPSYPSVMTRGHIFLSPGGTLVCDATVSLYGYALDGNGKSFTSTGRFNENAFTGVSSVNSLFLKVAGGFAEGTSFKIWGR